MASAVHLGQIDLETHLLEINKVSSYRGLSPGGRALPSA